VISVTGVPGPKELVRRGYDAVSYRYRGDDGDGGERGPWVERLVAAVPAGSRVLDLGCGCGIPVSRDLVAAGMRVTGVDLSDVQVSRARTLVPEATFVRADASEVEFPAGSFDAVVCLYTLIHVPRDEQPPLLAKVATWLRPGGWFVATTGYKDWTGTEQNWLGSGAPMWWSHPDADTYRAWLADAEFVVESEEFVAEGDGGHALFWCRRRAGEVAPTYSAIPAPRAGDLDAFTDGWLRNRRLSEHTRVAYRRDVGAWLSWCRARDLDPLTANFIHVNAYARELESTSDERTGKALTPATVARKLSGLSSWYGFLAKLGAVSANPVGGADRPRVARDHSATVGLSAEEVDALLAAADADTGPARARNQAVIAVLADLGLRVGEVIGLDISDLGYERGHRSVRFTGKGGTQRRRALTPASTAAVETYLLQRAASAGVPVDELKGALFVTASGARLDRHAVFRLVRRLAREAEIPAWARLSPHSLRHAFATTARDEGVPLEDVQDAMGHADPRTTRRYDRDRHNLDRDPSYTIWAARARRRSG